MVDLHSHTDASDGSDTPLELLDRAARAGVRHLAITDHDTLLGYEKAVGAARARGVELLCGIELSTKRFGKSVHLLGYFPNGRPPEKFCAWLTDLQDKRRDRNRRLAERLQSEGIDIRLEEVEAIGKTMAGRPHFARLLVKKGYVRTMQEAFDRYIAESGSAFVEREEIPFDEGVAKMREAMGVPVIAHPIRLGLADMRAEEYWLASAARAGVLGLEVQHSDHDEEAAQRYAMLAERLDLLPTGGSDYHGLYKPGVELGTGRGGNVSVPQAWLERLGGVAAGGEGGPRL